MPDYGTGKAKRRPMSLTVPVLGIAILVVLAMVARERSYHMTSTGLMVLIGILTGWFGGLLYFYG